MDKELIRSIPIDLWYAIATILGVALLFVLKQAFMILINMVKTWLENQKVEFSDLKEIVSNLVKMAERQDEKNKTYDRRLDDHDEDIRELRKNPNVKYSKG